MLIAACTPSADYDDSVNIAHLESAFGCSSPAGDRELEACNAIARFASAGRVHFPASATTVLVGQTLCASGGATELALNRYELSNAVSAVSPAVDAAHRASGSLSVQTVRVPATEENQSDASTTTRALAAGQDFELSRPEPAAELPIRGADWRAITRGAVSPSLCQSDGASLLLAPGSEGAWWQDYDHMPPTNFVREDSDGLIEVFSLPSLSVACVTAAYPLP